MEEVNKKIEILELKIDSLLNELLNEYLLERDYIVMGDLGIQTNRNSIVNSAISTSINTGISTGISTSINTLINCMANYATVGNILKYIIQKII